jgi:hypothetical protein
VALPAFAAPGGWQRFEIGDAGWAEVPVEPQPFETPGSSFAGSAFYYLAADDQPAAALGDGIHSDADSPPVSASSVIGPAARSLRVDNSGVDRTRALQCLTAAIYYEAATEPDAGQRAVAQVVLNRVAHPAFPKTVCGVVYQGSERSSGCQFTFTCDGSLARKPNPLFWERAEEVARQALAGYVYTPVGLATFYHTIAVHPAWDSRMIDVGTIGAHRFFRLPGPAGAAATFRFAYMGGEPIAAPHPRAALADAAPDPAPDPLAIERAYQAGLKSAQASAAAASSPAPPSYTAEVQQRGGDALYRGDKLPDGSGVRPEFVNSGRWIAQPGT